MQTEPQKKRMNTQKLLDRLGAFPTVSRDTNLPLIACVQDDLKPYGLAATRVPNDDGTKTNLYATIGPNTPGIALLLVPEMQALTLA
jgi:acetylornithine deacetylase